MTFRKTEYYLFPQTIEASEFVNEFCAELTKSGTKHERTDSTASIILYVESPHMELEVKDGKAVLPSMEELLKRAEQKGRADAIVQMVYIYENEAPCTMAECTHVEDDSYGCVRCIADFIKTREKEQKNG